MRRFNEPWSPLQGRNQHGPVVEVATEHDVLVNERRRIHLSRRCDAFEFRDGIVRVVSVFDDLTGVDEIEGIVFERQVLDITQNDRPVDDEVVGPFSIFEIPICKYVSLW